jgi:hypothetical protein
MTPQGQHPARDGTRRTTRHPARSIYPHNAPGSHARQAQEREELCGLAPEVDDRLAGFEQDLQDDLARERKPWFPKVLRLRRIDTTDNDEKRAA